MGNTDQTTLKRIYIIDKQPIFRIGVRQILQDFEGGFEIIEAENIEDLSSQNNLTPLDIIFFGVNSLDINTDNHDFYSLKTISRIQNLIICDGSREIDLDLFKYYFETLGAKGYLTKNCDSAELCDCLEKVFNGEKYVGNTTIINMITNLKPSKRLIKTSDAPKSSNKYLDTRLSKAESEVAEQLCLGKRTSEIARETGRKTSTISTIKSNIFKKMSVGNIIDLKRNLELLT